MKETRVLRTANLLDTEKSYRFRSTKKGKLVLQVSKVEQVKDWDTLDWEDTLVWVDAKITDLTEGVGE